MELVRNKERKILEIIVRMKVFLERLNIVQVRKLRRIVATVPSSVNRLEVSCVDGKVPVKSSAVP